MDGLASIMIFCGEKSSQADKTVEYCRNVYGHTPTIVSVNPQDFPSGKLYYTMPGEWNLKSLANTRRVWMSHVVALRGDIKYVDATLAILFSRSVFNQATFYYQDGELICFSSPREMLKRAIEDMLSDEYVDENDWHGLYARMKSTWLGSVSSISVEGNVF